MRGTDMESRPSSRAYAEAFRLAQEGDVPEVLALIDSSDRFIRHDAVKQIGRRRLSAAAPRLERLAAEDSDLRLAAMLALEKLALPESRRIFVERLEDEDEGVRRVALRGLLAIGDRETVPRAVETYRTGNTFTRQVSLYVLECTGIERSREALERLLEAEPSWRWRRKIRKSIRRAHWSNSQWVAS
jgi:HEAT repeat protein